MMNALWRNYLKPAGWQRLAVSDAVLATLIPVAVKYNATSFADTGFLYTKKPHSNDAAFSYLFVTGW